jgi:type II secretory pathway pseudopilin PulG
LHAWREPQLAAIQEQLGQINLPPLLAEGMRTERTGLCRTIQIELAARAKNGSRNPEAGVWQKVFNPDSRRWPLMPRGWFDQNLVTIAELGQKRIDSLDLTNHLVMVKRVNAWEKEVKRLGDHFRPYSWVAAIASPNFARAFQTVAENQTRADEALIACALERYRLAYGQYPETLAALAPQFLKKIPGDIINGQPLKYRRTADGQFALYSIGWDETDDDGSPALKRFGSMEPAKGDWVWVSAAN